MVQFGASQWALGLGALTLGKMNDGTCFYGEDSVRVVVKSANDSGVPGLVLARLSQLPLEVSVGVACHDGRGSIDMYILLLL